MTCIQRDDYSSLSLKHNHTKTKRQADSGNVGLKTSDRIIRILFVQFISNSIRSILPDAPGFVVSKQTENPKTHRNRLVAAHQVHNPLKKKESRPSRPRPLPFRSKRHRYKYA